MHQTMLSVIEGGAYLAQGTEIVPDGPQAQEALKARTGKEKGSEAGKGLLGFKEPPL